MPCRCAAGQGKGGEGESVQWWSAMHSLPCHLVLQGRKDMAVKKLMRRQCCAQCLQLCCVPEQSTYIVLGHSRAGGIYMARCGHGHAGSQEMLGSLRTVIPKNGPLSPVLCMGCHGNSMEMLSKHHSIKRDRTSLSTTIRISFWGYAQGRRATAAGGSPCSPDRWPFSQQFHTHHPVPGKSQARARACYCLSSISHVCPGQLLILQEQALLTCFAGMVGWRQWQAPPCG